MTRLDFAPYLDCILAHHRGQGQGHNIIRDHHEQLSPPEAALWTGKRYQAALLICGLEVWMELRLDRLLVRQERDRAKFIPLMTEFVGFEDKLP